MIEVRSIQNSAKRMTRKDETPDHVAKTFAKLMMKGKVNAAIRLLDKQESLGVAKLTESTIEELKRLHPEAQPATEGILMTGPKPYFDPIVFGNIDESCIEKAATRTKGAAGPSGLDPDGWRRRLISKNYGKDGKDLRTALARMTHTLCTREMVEESRQLSLEAYVANRLIHLESDLSE